MSGIEIASLYYVYYCLVIFQFAIIFTASLLIIFKV
jgi:hypothetical protein